MHSDENDVFALLHHLDHPAPTVTMDAIAARARRRRAVRGWRWAATILLTTTLGGVAWAAPGSPVPGWIAAALERVAGPRAAPRTEGGAPAAVSPPPPAAGIAVPPGRRLAIVFGTAEPGGTARVVLTDAEQVTVRAESAAVGFTTERDRLLVEPRTGNTDFEIAIPRSAARIEIRVGQRRVFMKELGRVTAPDSAGPGGPYHIRLGQTGDEP